MGSDAESGRAAHGLEMGPAVCGTLAQSADADARWHPKRPDERDAARRPGLPVARQFVPALRLRYVDVERVPGSHVRTLRRLCGDPLCDRTAGTPGARRY